MSAYNAVFSWEKLKAAALENLKSLAKYRGWTVEETKWLVDHDLLGLRGVQPCVPVRQNGAVVAAKIRKIDVHTSAELGKDTDPKWFTSPPGQGQAPIILGDITTARSIIFCESQWDGYTYALKRKLHLDPTISEVVICHNTVSAFKGIDLSGKQVFVLMQNDEPARKWFAELLKLFPETEFNRIDIPTSFKDLNELHKAQPLTCEDLMALLANAAPCRHESAVKEELPAPDMSLREIVEADLAFLKRFIQFSDSGDALIVAYWCLASWFVDHLNYAPYLFITSPQPGCGKTTLLDCIELLVRNAARASGISAAALFRLIEDCSPTWLQDEIDTIWGEDANSSNEDLRCVFNAGTRRRSAYIYRCGGANRTTLEKFSVFGFKAVAGIGKNIPQTIRERGFTIFLDKITAKSQVDEAEDELIVAGAPQTGEAKKAWARSILKLERVERGPSLQKALDPRQKECAAALLSLAALAGQQAELEVAIIANFAGSAAENDSDTIQLLTDIREIMTGQYPDKLETIEDIIHPIREAGLSSGFWWEPEKELAAAKWIAKKLKPFRIFPIRWKEGGTVRRGYAKSDLVAACSRYLPSLPSPASEVLQNQELNGDGYDDENDLL